jgi:hypothetical protein
VIGGILGAIAAAAGSDPALSAAAGIAAVAKILAGGAVLGGHAIASSRGIRTGSCAVWVERRATRD